MNIAQSLRKLMEERHLSSSKLAREIHVHTSTVSNWLDGKDVKAENLETLCRYFNCTLDYLAGATEKKPAPQDELTMDDFTYAMHKESGDLTDEDKAWLLSKARQIAEDNRRRKSD